MAGNVIEYFSPTRAGLLARRTINIFSLEMLGYELMAMGQPTMNSTTTTADSVFHHPLLLSSPFTISQFFWVNGTAVNGTTDIGIYTDDGQRLLVSTGATSNVGTSAIQLVDITDFTLPPNRRLWLTLGTSSATQQYTRMVLTAPAADYAGIKTMASALSGGALPATVTFAVGGNSAIWCGITGSSML